MNRREGWVRKTFAAALVISGVAVFAMGRALPHSDASAALSTPERLSDQETQTDPSFKSNARQQPSPSPGLRPDDNKQASDATRYSYEFAQPQFYIAHIVVEHDARGVGKITFERLGEPPPIIEPVAISTAALGRITRLWNDLGFLQSTENYQAPKQFPHLGTMHLHLENGERQRTVEFNWTNNKQASALINEYRRVADQAIFLFDLAVARENQPLNTPKLMEQLENLVTRNGLSEPFQLVPLLKELTTDERLPLIARNHAGRILKLIQK